MITLVANSYSLQIITQITQYSVDDLLDIKQKLCHNTPTCIKQTSLN